MYKTVAIIDGDNPPMAEQNDYVFTLPEGSPESVVFEYIKENAESISALIQQRCQCPTVSQDQIVKCIFEVVIDTTDPHLYFAKIGEKLGFVSEIVMRRGLCSIDLLRKLALPGAMPA